MISTILLQHEMMEVVVVTTSTLKTKLQSNQHQQQTNTQVSYRLHALCHPTTIVEALKRYRITNSMHKTTLLTGSVGTAEIS